MDNSKPIILRPPSPDTETVAQLWVSGEVLCLRLAEYRDDFRQTARGLGFQWSPVRYRWERHITAFSGPLEDRFIQAAHRLLLDNFIVEIPGDSPVDRIAAGDYAEEQTRWIFKRADGRYAGWFAIQWGRDEDFYQRAKWLVGARFSKPSVVVPADQFEEVADFAELHGFQLSPAAQQLIAEAEERRRQMVRVELRPRTITTAVSAMPEPTGEIAEELLDKEDV